MKHTHTYKCKRTLFSVLVFTILGLAATTTNAAEFTLHAGAQNHSGSWETGDSDFDSQDHNGNGYHYGFSFKNRIGSSKKHYLGTGVDINDILDSRMIGLRAIDYQYALMQKLRVGGFFGAATINTGRPQNGYYLGANVNYHFKHLAIGFEIRHGNGMARDRISGDPQGVKPDIFLDFIATGVHLSWTF